ncbi:MAG: hypothetical protein HWE25_11865 [Alphaproteobacteria bacterium]|nr:hypothetical protein [Alphaproteobacteria bacterium]
MAIKAKKRLITLALLTVLTSACSHLDMGTLWKYRNVDFLEVNPETTRLAIRLPEGIDIRNVRLSLAGTAGGAPAFSGDIDFDIIRSGPEMTMLPTAIGQTHAIVLKIPRESLKEARQLQINAHQLSQTPGHNGLSMGFNISTGEETAINHSSCDGAAFPTMSVWIKLEENEHYSRLVSEKSFKKILAESICGASDN